MLPATSAGLQAVNQMTLVDLWYEGKLIGFLICSSTLKSLARQVGSMLAQ